MKITHPLAIRSAALVLSLWLRAWLCATRIREQFADPASHPARSPRPRLYLFWHENLGFQLTEQPDDQIVRARIDLQ